METPWPEDMYAKEVEEITQMLVNEAREELLALRYGKEVVEHFKEIIMGPIDPNVKFNGKINWTQLLSDAKESTIVENLLREHRPEVIKFLKEKFPEEFI